MQLGRSCHLLLLTAGLTAACDASATDSTDGLEALCEIREGPAEAEPCVPGIWECVQGEPTMRRVCRAGGKGHCYRPCDDGLYCELEFATCQRPVCEPGEFLGCKDLKTSLRCDDFGSEIVEVACHGCVPGDAPDNPLPCVCRDTHQRSDPPPGIGCQPLLCRPGATKCRGSDEVHMCNDQGTGWELIDDCGWRFARICEEFRWTLSGEPLATPAARCVSPCPRYGLREQDEIGCEYWAVGLDPAAAHLSLAVSNADGGDRSAIATARLVGADGQLWCGTVAADAPGSGPPGSLTCHIRRSECEAHAAGGPCEQSWEIAHGDSQTVRVATVASPGSSRLRSAYRLLSDVPVAVRQWGGPVTSRDCCRWASWATSTW